MTTIPIEYSFRVLMCFPFRSCIMAEMLLKKPLFPGNDEITQLENIWKICGTPSEDNWPGISSLPWWNMMRPKQNIPRSLRDVMKRYFHSCISFMRG